MRHRLVRVFVHETPESRTEAMKNPTELEMVDVYRREFPLSRIGDSERAFLAFVHIARSHGVGWGFMRQAIGLHWKEADPVGYIDDARIRKLFAEPLHDALVKYGEHDGDCAASIVGAPGDATCTCGYDAACELQP